MEEGVFSRSLALEVTGDVEVNLAGRVASTHTNADTSHFGGQLLGAQPGVSPVPIVVAQSSVTAIQSDIVPIRTNSGVAGVAAESLLFQGFLMAEDLDDGEFWLPSEFLTDDDILIDTKNRINGALADGGARFCFPPEFPYGFSSPLSSPVESVVGSTETESDEEDLMAGLTREMARSMLQDHVQSIGRAFGVENSKTWVLSGSPQSTLSAVGSWSAGSAGSSRGSSNGPSQVSSPPSTPMNGKDDAWDLLYAAAGQVVRMKMNDEVPKCHQGPGLLGPPRNHAPVSPHIKNPNAATYSNPALSHQQLQSNQLKQQQVMKQQCSSVWGKQGKLAGTVQQQHQQQVVNNRPRTGGFGNARCSRSSTPAVPLGLSASAWPPLQPQQQQQQVGSGMRAVFLGGSGSRRESTGTGVFLPRRVGNPAESRKKPACSTVLVPARVVQALNLNFDDIGAQPLFGGGSTYDHDARMAGSRAMFCQQNLSLRSQAAMNHELRLPQEWTYCP
ncbi:hypothetical protein NE237_009885 [Protea cynaroides]|uniref:Uncharacterized protein n=1 Tax=Protea cynaroides TaxID=273540 RepID=A0A9Q0R0P7_9MAGN|nr:hypothetical protein NE237_009885 [Protea cynaroides]